jgi:transcription initiation factor TFIIIB Brf1 subunit/transcription initiation factor TFIIB
METEIWNLYNQISDSFVLDDDDDELIEEKKEIKKNTCYNCGISDCLQTNNENIVCVKCGVVNDDIIDYQAEWRYYGTDDNKKTSDPNRCGIPNSHISESSLGTVILGKGYEVYRKLNSWNGLTYKERSLISILNKIVQKANMDNVPQSIIDATMSMYKIISQDYIKRGASRESLIAACFFNALRDQGLIRSNEEIAKLFDIKSKKLSKGCNEFTELMFLKNKDYIKKMKPVESKDLTERFCLLLDIQEQYIKIAVRAAAIIDKLGICQENNPKSISVGCIYLISQNYGLGLSKKDIAENCKTSEVTVTNTYCQMIKFKKYLLPIEKK